MRKITRIKNLLIALIMIAFAVLLLAFPEVGPLLIVILLGAGLIIEGIRSLIYYFTMAKNMVGGKKVLFRSIFILDIGAFLLTGCGASNQLIFLYLLGMLAASGGIDIIRALELKKEGARWKHRLISGLLAFVLLIAALIFMSDPQVVVYIFCIQLIYTAITRLVSVFRKTAVIYIPE